jgi:hypothetical protein
MVILNNVATLGYLMIAVEGVKSVTMSGEPILTNVSMDILDVAMLGSVTTAVGREKTDTISTAQRIFTNMTTASILENVSMLG